MPGKTAETRTASGPRRWPSLAAWAVVSAAIAGCALPGWSLSPTGWWTRSDGVLPKDPLVEKAEAGKRLTADQQATLIRRVEEALGSEASGWRRSRLVLLLGPLSSPAAAGVLQKALDDPSPRVRIAACQALAAQPGERAIASLAAVLSNDSDLDVRLEAARSLSQFSSDQAILALAAALDDPDPAIQYRVVQSLRETSGQPLGNDVAQWKKYAASVMVNHGASALSQATTDDGAVRR